MPKLKVQPSAIDAEEAILGSIIKDNDIISTVESWIRDEEAFYSEANKKIRLCMKNLNRTNKPIDIIILSAELKEQFNQSLNAYYITGLPETVVTTANIEHWCKIVWHRFIQREAVKSAHKLYDTSLEDNKDITEILHEHERIIEELKFFIRKTCMVREEDTKYLRPILKYLEPISERNVIDISNIQYPKI